jgi:hypothetical protein
MIEINLNEKCIQPSLDNLIELKQMSFNYKSKILLS